MALGAHISLHFGLSVGLIFSLVQRSLGPLADLPLKLFDDFGNFKTGLRSKRSVKTFMVKLIVIICWILVRFVGLSSGILYCRISDLTTIEMGMNPSYST